MEDSGSLVQGVWDTENFLELFDFVKWKQIF